MFYFGVDLFEEKFIKVMKFDVLWLFIQIIEIIKKFKVFIGQLVVNLFGDVFEVNEEDYGKEFYWVILDIGMFDIFVEYFILDDEDINIVNVSLDMLVVDLGDKSFNYKVGDEIFFQFKYMGVLSLFNFDYIEKWVIE